MMENLIYLDNAATTKPLKEVADIITENISSIYGNPSSLHEIGLQSRNIINNARKTIGEIIGAPQETIYFVSGGSEADTWALTSMFNNFKVPYPHIITTKIEHHAILNTCKNLERQGARVTYLDVDETGMVSPSDVEAAICDNTILISVMTANNEIGTIQPIEDISDIAAHHNILFHTDAVQAFAHMDIDVNKLGVDMMSVSAHKFGGTKGIGFLYASNRIPLSPIIFGGGQQFGKRAGTENILGIMGMVKAVEIMCDEARLQENISHMENLRDYMRERIVLEIPNVKVNGHWDKRLANNLNVSFIGVRGEQLLALLAMDGICVSTGSACDSFSNEPSHVLKAIGLTDDEANSSIRFSLSQNNTREEINYVVDVLKRDVEDLRSMDDTLEV